MQVDEVIAKMGMEVDDDLSETSTSSVDGSASASGSSEGGGYETGDSEELGVDSGSELGSESDGSNGSNSGSESDAEEAMPSLIDTNVDIKIVSQAQKMLRASVAEELDRIQLLPTSEAVEFAAAQAESSLVKLNLKHLKNLIQEFPSCDVNWSASGASSTSQNSKKSSSSASPSSNKSKSSSSTPPFDASSFLKAYYADIGGERLARSLQKEFNSSDASAEPASSKSFSNHIFNWSSPTAFNVIGSYLLGTAMRSSSESDGSKSSPSDPLYTIDLSFTMNDDMFKHRDIKGHRYETKRLLYLAVLAQNLESALASSNENMSAFSHLSWHVDRLEDISCPVLSLTMTVDLSNGEDSKSKQKSAPTKKRRRSAEAKRYIRILLRPCITPTTFKLSQLLPWKPHRLLFGAMPTDHLTAVYREISGATQSLVPEAPLVVQKATSTFAALHNHRIARESLMAHSNMEMAGLFQAFPGLRSAVVLTNRWISSRRLSHVFNTHIVSSLYAYIASVNVVRPTMDALDLFKNFITWLAIPKQTKLSQFEKLLSETHGVGTSATRDIHVLPPTLAMPKTKLVSESSDWKTAHASSSAEVLKSAFSKCFDAVLIDSTGYINVLATVSSASWSALSFEALASSRLLELPDQYTFSTLFKTSISQGDSGLKLAAQPPISSDFDFWLVAAPNESSDLLTLAPASIRLPSSTTVFAKAEPTQTTKKLQSTALLGGRKAGSQTITITSTNGDGSAAPAQIVDEAKTKEANEWLSALATTSIALNAVDAIQIFVLVSRALLYHNLLPRVEYATFFYGLVSKHTGAPIAWKVGREMPSDFEISIGLKVQPTQWQKLLEYGPQAQQEDAVADFVRLWGKGTAGLRKFKDGLILYCVSWGTPPSVSSPENVNNIAANANKHRIIQRVITHLLNRHLSHSALTTGAPASNTSESIWTVSMLGDEILRAHLAAPERVNPDLVGPTFKPVPAPLSNTDSHDHITFVWTQLQKLLRGLKGLSMPIKTLTLPGPLARSSSATPPEYNPLSDPEIPFSQRQFAIRSASTAAQLCPAAVPVILQFESSGAWPEDLDAISHVKTALYLELSRHLTEQQASATLASRPSADALFIYFKGYTFQVEIFHPRELIIRNMLYRQVVIAQRTDEQQRILREKISKMEHMKQIAESKSIVPSNFGASSSSSNKHTHADVFSKQGAVPLVGPVNTHVEPLQSVADAFSKFGVSPKVSSLLHSLQLAYPAFGPTCVLVKKWLAAHLLPLSQFADGLLIDLLVSRVFHATPYLSAPWTSPPAHAYAAFQRVLFLLAHLSWESGPIIVPLHEDHQGGHQASISVLTTTNTSPLGWTLEKIEKLQQKWKRTDENKRAVLTIYFNDGSSAIETEDAEHANENGDTSTDANGSEQAQLSSSKFNVPGVATLAYGTPNSRNTTDWCVDAFSARAILARLRRLAVHSLNSLQQGASPAESSKASGSNPGSIDSPLSFIFEPSLLDFDLVIELKKNALTSHLGLNREIGKRKSSKSRSSPAYISQTNYFEPPSDLVSHVEATQTSLGATVPPVMPNFDPVANFIAQVSERLSGRSLIFHDATGGPLLGIVLKPSSFAPLSNISNSNAIHALALSDVRLKTF